jgi:cytochrome c556
LRAVLLLLAVGVVSASSVENRITTSRKAVKEFAGELKGELQAAMKGGGPVNAVTVCSEKAPAIANRISEDRGWEVGRTSLKTRNPNNVPDTWERKTLEAFEERRRQGEDVGKMEHSEVVTADGKSVFRYMKAIPAGELCLTCHGKEIVHDLAAKISELYPEDRATGFSLGEIRGAFSISQPMP